MCTVSVLLLVSLVQYGVLFDMDFLSIHVQNSSECPKIFTCSAFPVIC